MDAQVITDNLIKQETYCGKLVEKTVMNEAKDFGNCEVTIGENGASLGPMTPNHKRENGDFPFDSLSPPNSVSSPPEMVLESDYSKDDCSLNGVACCSPRTPKSGMFNPFAPGPDDKMLAPLCKKYMSESRFSVARRLDFDSSDTPVLTVGKCGDEADVKLDEEMLLKLTYDSLLEFIVLMQTGGKPADIFPSTPLDFDGFRTPTSAPRLTGIAETCPDAPRKRMSKLLNLDMGLCRKLEF